jgi:hypothetical protein
VLAAVLITGAAGACGGGGGGGSGTAQTPAAPAAPAAAIDPSSNNVITGPINRARTVAEQQDGQTRQLDQQSGGGQP